MVDPAKEEGLRWHSGIGSDGRLRLLAAGRAGALTSDLETLDLKA